MDLNFMDYLYSGAARRRTIPVHRVYRPAV